MLCLLCPKLTLEEYWESIYYHLVAWIMSQFGRLTKRNDSSNKKTHEKSWKEDYYARKHTHILPKKEVSFWLSLSFAHTHTSIKTLIDFRLWREKKRRTDEAEKRRQRESRWKHTHTACRNMLKNAIANLEVDHSARTIVVPCFAERYT